jgi:hypothetical protein
MGKVLRAGFFLLLAGIAFAADWQVEVVDPSGVGKFSSMKADKDGNLHVAYVQDGDDHTLKYAFHDHRLNRWFLMTVAHSSGACSLTLDSKQRPHISYVDFGTASGATVHHVFWDPSANSWQNNPIRLSSDIVAYYNSIALDAEDRPSISFYEYRGPKDSEIRIRMRVVTWDGRQWDTRTVDPQEGSGKFNSMVSDAQGHLHLAYANVSSGTESLRYAYWNGNSWTKRQIVDDASQNNGDAVGYSAAIALDRDGNPNVTYINESTPTVKYAVRKNGRWEVYAIQRLSAMAYPDRNSIAVSEDGRPFIAYYDAGRGTLNLAYPDGQRWLINQVDAGTTGYTSSIQIVNNQIWISYADEGRGALKVAHTDLPAVRTNTSAVQTPPVQP